MVRAWENCKRSTASVFVLLVLLLGLANSTVAPAASGTLQTKARHAIVMDAHSGEVLFEKAADTVFQPASMSKIMTMIMVFEALKRGELSLDDEFTISKHAWKIGGPKSGRSTMFAKRGASIRVEDLIRGAIVQSGNDAAIAIAEGIAGSERAFADLMTRRARELGLKQTSFATATGLPHPNHKTTVRELALIARHQIFELAEYYPYYAEKTFTWNGVKQNNRNPLLYQNIGADGLKTGFIRASGYSLVASAVRGGRRLILVVSGLRSAEERSREARKLIDWGFSR